MLNDTNGNLAHSDQKGKEEPSQIAKYQDTMKLLGLFKNNFYDAKIPTVKKTTLRLTKKFAKWCHGTLSMKSNILYESYVFE
jgi:hypothetical protein